MCENLNEFVKMINVKLNLKYVIKNLEFEKKNDNYYVKEDGDYHLNAKFETNEIVIWCSENPYQKYNKKYLLIDNEEEYVNRILNIIK